jgi:hypothetical protein
MGKQSDRKLVSTQPSLTLEQRQGVTAVNREAILADPRVGQFHDHLFEKAFNEDGRYSSAEANAATNRLSDIIYSKAGDESQALQKNTAPSVTIKLNGRPWDPVSQTYLPQTEEQEADAWAELEALDAEVKAKRLGDDS